MNIALALRLIGLSAIAALPNAGLCQDTDGPNSFRQTYEFSCSNRDYTIEWETKVAEPVRLIRFKTRFNGSQPAIDTANSVQSEMKLEQAFSYFGAISHVSADCRRETTTIILRGLPISQMRAYNADPDPRPQSASKFLLLQSGVFVGEQD